MLILVAVTVRIAVDSGLFGHAQNATNRWASEQRKENGIGNGKVEINGKEYNSIEEYLNRNEEEKATTTYTIIKEYYISGQITATAWSTPIEINVGDVISGADISNQNPNWSYRIVNGTKLEFTYASSDPNSLILSENSSENIITLRYERNV